MISLYPRRRATATELMDDPESNRELLERTLGQFSHINRLLTRSRTVLHRELLSDMEARVRRAEVPRNHRFTVLDAGAGGCDLPLWLIDEGERRGLTIHVTAVDADPRVVAYAKRVALPQAAPGTLTIVEGSVLAGAGAPSAVTPPFDYIFANHFLHHLTDDQIRQFLKISRELCRRRIVINDLLRSWVWLWLYRLVAQLFLRGSFARNDGAVSILKGFRPRELAALCTGEGGPAQPCRVRRMLPGRVLLVIDR